MSKNEDNDHYTVNLNCGCVDWDGSGECNHPVTIELRLHIGDQGKWVFSMCGVVRSPSGKAVAAGQCLDEIFSFTAMDPWRELHGIWKEWHLNDLTPGSPRQEEAVRKWRARRRKAGKWNGGWDYDEACKMLEKKGLLVDRSFKYNGKPYKYGTAWLTREIPPAVVEVIKDYMCGRKPDNG